MAVIFAATSALVLGCLMWFIFYGLECFMNGVFTRPGKSDIYMMFASVWEEFMWNMPGGYEKKVKLCNGDMDLVKSLPGPIHFVILHILLPFGLPAIILFNGFR